MSLIIERITEHEAFEGLTAEWRTLEDHLSPRLPFASPCWNAAWWRHLRRTQLSIRDEFYFHTVRENGVLIAVAPLMISETPGFGRHRYRHLQFIGADLHLTELRGLVCREADEERVLRALSNHLVADRKEWRSIRWSGVRHVGGLSHLAGEGWQLRASPAIQDYCLDLPATWAQFHAGRRRNVKESMRRAYNSLRRDGHEFTLHVLTTPAEVPGGLARFLALHAARADANYARRHPNFFAAAAPRAFLTECVTAMAQIGQLRLFELRIAGETVASRIAFAMGDELYYYYSGFMPEWGRYSVMTALLAESLKWAIDNGVRTANLSVHAEQSKLRWGPQEISFHEYVQVPTGLRNQLPYRAFRLATSIRRSVRRAAHRLSPA